MCVGSTLWVDADVSVCVFTCVNAAVDPRVFECVVCACVGICAFECTDMRVGSTLCVNVCVFAYAIGTVRLDTCGCVVCVCSVSA